MVQNCGALIEWLVKPDETSVAEFEQSMRNLGEF